jgi:RNA polymerase sigma factor (sigma-70 family)
MGEDDPCEGAWGMVKSAAGSKFTDHIVSLRRYAASLTRCRHDAEDLVQECLTRAIAAAATLRSGAPVRPWLFRILHNAHVSRLRHQQVRDANQHHLVVEDHYDPPQASHLEFQSVLTSLAKLPEAQRQAITLIALEALSYEEAAQVLGIPIGTLMSRLARGREALRQELEGLPATRLRVVGGRNDE